MTKRAAPQLPLALVAPSGWGGARAGAGRKPRGAESGISHARELEVDRHTPVHVTLRAREHVWNLRSKRCYAVFAAALRGVRDRPDFLVVHYSIQGNHAHLVVEAESGDALARGMRAVTGRLALRLNSLMGTHGGVFADRYHAHVLRTPAEVRNALAYALGNFASHARRRGERVPLGHVDPYSSAAERAPDGARPPVSEPRSWLLRTGGIVAREAVAEYGATAGTRASPGGSREVRRLTPASAAASATSRARTSTRRRPLETSADSSHR